MPSTANYFDNSPAQSVARAAVYAANAALITSLSRGLTTAGVATGTTTSKVKTVSTFNYTVLGRYFTKAATDDFWTLSGTVVKVSSFQKYLLLIDTAGAASIAEATQSTVSAAAIGWGNLSGVSPWAPFLTAMGDTKVCVGTLTVATNASTTFTPGTTLLGAAGITSTYIDGLDQSVVPLIAGPQGSLFGSVL